MEEKFPNFKESLSVKVKSNFTPLSDREFKTMISSHKSDFGLLTFNELGLGVRFSPPLGFPA